MTIQQRIGAFMLVFPFLWLGAVLYQVYSAPTPESTTALWPHWEAMNIIVLSHLTLTAVSILGGLFTALAFSNREWRLGFSTYGGSLVLLGFAVSLLWLPAYKLGTIGDSMTSNTLKTHIAMLWLGGAVGLFSKPKPRKS